MKETYNRKKEISDLYFVISKLEKEEDKKILFLYSFPRMYGHFEKNLENSFLKLINNILSENLKILDLNDRLAHYFLFLNTMNCKNETYLNKFSNINFVHELKKPKITKEIQSLNISEKFFLLMKLIQEDKINDLNKKIDILNIKVSIIKKKYQARSHIAHGHLNLEEIEINQEDFLRIRNLILETFDLFDDIIDEYLKKKYYVK